MIRDRLLGQAQPLADALYGITPGQQPQDLEFPGGQRIDDRFRLGRGMLRHDFLYVGTQVTLASRHRGDGVDEYFGRAGLADITAGPCFESTGIARF